MGTQQKDALAKFRIAKEFTGTGVVGAAATSPYQVPAENTLAIKVENVGGGNAITVYGRMFNSSTWDTLTVLTGAITKRLLDISLIDEIYFDCTAYAASGGTPKLIVNGFFQPIENGLIVDTYDYVAYTYVPSGSGAGEIQTATYKNGGSSGTTVATLTYAYDSSNRVSSITRS